MSLGFTSDHQQDLAPDPASGLAIDILREVIVTLVRRDAPTLSAHQFGVFLTCYLRDQNHTVRSLALELGVSKSVISRALDKLTEMGLAERREDPADKRSIHVSRTTGGQAMLQDLQQIAAGYRPTAIKP